MSSVAPIPTDWCDAVIKILKRSDPKECRWSFRVRQDWQPMGMAPQAYALLIKTLEQRVVWGERVRGMHPLPKPPKGEQQVVYAFLCKHPFNPDLPIYAKIGLFDGHLCLDLFSLHNDYTNELIKKITAAKKQLKAAQKKARKHGN
jgi:hypothetical protein